MIGWLRQSAQRGLMIDPENTIVGNETLRQYSGDLAVLNTLLWRLHLAVAQVRNGTNI
jgi:hypothetical protein